MALGDEQIDRLVNGFDVVLSKRITQLDAALAARIESLRELVNGVKVTNTTTFDAPEVRKPQPL